MKSDIQTTGPQKEKNGKKDTGNKVDSHDRHIRKTGIGACAKWMISPTEKEIIQLDPSDYQGDKRTLKKDPEVEEGMMIGNSKEGNIHKGKWTVTN